MPGRDRLVRPGAPLAVRPLPFEPPPGTIQSKSDTFLRWAGDRLGSEKLFLAGHEGLCLAQSSLAPELVVSSTWAVSAWVKAREVLGCEGGGTAVFEGPGEKALVLVVEEGEWGMRGFGAIVGSQPEASILAEIGRSLRALIHSVEAHEAPGPAFK